MITGRDAPVYPAWNVDALDSSTEHGGSQSLVPLAIDEPSGQQTGSKRLEIVPLNQVESDREKGRRTA